MSAIGENHEAAHGLGQLALARDQQIDLDRRDLPIRQQRDETSLGEIINAQIAGKHPETCAVADQLVDGQRIIDADPVADLDGGPLAAPVKMPGPHASIAARHLDALMRGEFGRR